MNQPILSSPAQIVAEQPIFRIEVQARKQDNPPASSGDTRLTNWQKIHLYFLQGDLNDDQVRTISRKLLTDPVTETFSISSFDPTSQKANQQQNPTSHTIDITLLPGVTDPVAENLLRAAHLLGIKSLERAATGQRYIIQGDLSPGELQKLATQQFSNPVIQRYEIDQPIAPPFVPVQHEDDTVEIIALTEADDAGLLRISAERRLALDLAEMQAIQKYFQGEKRESTDVELEMLAQTWSEHCVHKTFKAMIDYDGPEGQITIDGLLNTYIRAATEKVNKPWVRSAFVDNAGIIAFDDQYDLAFKVETHNHPSALEPFGGANTGVGGVVRDILGVSARPIANTDILCFGPPDLPDDQMPEGVLHPRRIAEGVIHGVEDYGNKMGIPTVNGAIVYHPGYTSNPLVFCGCLGILPHGSHPNKIESGDFIVVIGGRTGRDGLRGATFSSMEMDQTTGQIAGSAVQIGHPIHEKQVQEVVLRTRDEKLYHAITDCGAGGLSSAVGEMAAKIGGRVQLADVPLKYPGLRPWEIWLSEAQERMVFAVPEENWARFQTICDGQDVESVNIGTFESTGRLELFYNEKLVGNVSTEFLHDGIPQRHLKAEWKNPLPLAPSPLRVEGKQNHSLSDTLLKLLAHPNIRSKEAVIRRYDHEVQAGMAVKPLVGVDNHGPADAAVIVPLDTIKMDGSPQRGVAIANGICPLYGEGDPYAMAWAAIDEAIRNLVAVGADPDQIAILDNFCWGNPTLPDRLGSLVRCAQGCYDAAVAYGVPFISGKDSLNNEYTGADGRKHAIPGTLLISAIGIVTDVNKTVTMDLKAPENLLYVIGETRDEMGGSHYNLVNGISGGSVPQPNKKAMETYRGLYKAIETGLVVSCHDISEGGIAVALAEMCIAGRLGAGAGICGVGNYQTAYELFHRMLFSETQGRFLVEVHPDNQKAFHQFFPRTPKWTNACKFAEVERSQLTIWDQDWESNLITLPISDLERSWRGEHRTRQDLSLQRPAVEAKVPLARQVSGRTSAARVLILHANGTNRDRDAFLACELAGSAPEIVHVNQLMSGERKLLDYHMLVVPGGFSYGDDLGAGKLWALDLQNQLDADVKRFVDEGRPVIGICNGFQALVKAGLLPGEIPSPPTPLPHGEGLKNNQAVTLTFNESGHFECRWVYLQPNPNSPSLFTAGLTEPIYCPVAHGEGRIVVDQQETLDQLWKNGLAALTYTDANGQAAGYPTNPNGSVYNIAGLCNAAGNVFGLMPHPEDHIFPWQHPRWRRGDGGMDGLRLFKNGVKYA